MAIIAYTTVKTLLGIADTNTSEDAKLALLCSYVDRAVKTWVGLDIEAASYPGAGTAEGDSGIYSGDDTRYLVIRQRPIRTVTSIYEDLSGAFDQNPDGSFAAATLLTSGTDYEIAYDGYVGSAPVSNRGIIERRNGVWRAIQIYRRGVIGSDLQTSQGTIKVTYAGGWATVPPDIVQAAALWVSHMRRNMKKGGFITSENLGGYSYSVQAPLLGGMPPDVARLLARYREVRL